MNALIRAAADVQAVCEPHQWRYCFIGGLAALRWGEPRETVDVDVTVITGFGNETAFVSVLARAFQPRIDDAAAFAQVNRVLLLRAASGVGLDIALGGLPFEELAVARSTPPRRGLHAYGVDGRLVSKYTCRMTLRARRSRAEDRESYW